MNRDLEAEWAAESATARAADIARLNRMLASFSPAKSTTAFALALTMRKQALERAEREARIERGEICERCGGTDIEHTSAITPLFYCRECMNAWFDLGAP